MHAGIYEQDLRSLRSRQAKAMMAAVKDYITHNRNLNFLNKNGVALVRERGGEEDKERDQEGVSEGGRGKEGERKREREREREKERGREGKREREKERGGRETYLSQYFSSLQLHIASANGYYRIAKLLLDGGAGVDVLDDLGYTPLHVATKFNQVN